MNFGFERKGQIALEYLAIMAFALLLALPFILNAQNSALDLGAVSRSSMAKNALSAVKEAAELVYSQGEPARVSFKINLPFGINSSTVNGTELSFTLTSRTGSFKVYEVLSFNATGKLPVNPGIHTIIVKAEENYVNITY